MQRLNVTISKPVDFRDPEYIERVLVDLQPTEHVQVQLEALSLELAKHVDGSHEHSRLCDMRQRLELTLERCLQRDVIAAERPENCWCLGLGGRGRRYGIDGEVFWDATCRYCPEGEREEQRNIARGMDREARRLRERHIRLFEKARVPERFQGCTLESYPVSPETQPALDAIRDWLTPPEDEGDEWDAWLERNRQSLLLHGPFGVGKTGLAVAILRQRIDTARGGLFFTVPTLLDHIRRTYGPNPTATEHDVIDAVQNAPLLVLDDLGAERVTEWVREKLFTIINYRHDEDLPTIFTSNLDIVELGEHIGERTTWRIVEMATIVKITGPNLRDRSTAA